MATHNVTNRDIHIVGLCIRVCRVKYAKEGFQLLYIIEVTSVLFKEIKHKSMKHLIQV